MVRDVDPSPRSQGPSLAHLVQFISLGSNVVHQDLVGRQFILDGSPGVLRLLQPHAAPQLVDDLHPEPGPVLDVELAQLAVGLHLGLAAGDLLHEGGQLHGLADQGPAHCAEMRVRLGGQSQVVSDILTYLTISVLYSLWMVVGCVLCMRVTGRVTEAQ